MLSVLSRAEDERLLPLKWKFKSSLKEHLLDAAVSDNKLWQAMSCAAWQLKQFLEARMQIEHINVRSHCMSGPAKLWEPIDWWSRGQQVPARLFISQCVLSGQTGGEARGGTMAGREEAGRYGFKVSVSWMGDPPSDILKFFYSSLAAWYLLPKVEIQKNQKTPCCLAVFNIKSIFPSNNVFHIVPLLC